MFAVDRTGRVRYGRVFGPLENIPGNDALLQALSGLAGGER